MQARGRGWCCGQAGLSELSAGSDQASTWACLLAGGRELKRTGDRVRDSFLLWSPYKVLCPKSSVSCPQSYNAVGSENIAKDHYDVRTPLSSLSLCLCSSPARGLHTVPEICQKIDYLFIPMPVCYPDGLLKDILLLDQKILTRKDAWDILCPTTHGQIWRDPHLSSS